MVVGTKSHSLYFGHAGIHSFFLSVVYFVVILFPEFLLAEPLAAMVAFVSELNEIKHFSSFILHFLCFCF